MQVGNISCEMVFVKVETFWMGTQNDDPNRQNYDFDANDDEKPVHQVTLTDYWIGKF